MRANAHIPIYIGVQIIGYLVDLACFMGLVQLEAWPIVWSNYSAKTVSGTTTFFLHRYFTFPDGRAEPLGRQALKYYTLLIINTQVNTLFLLGIDFLIDNVFVSKLMAEGASFVLSYLISKRFVFKGKYINYKLSWNAR